MNADNESMRDLLVVGAGPVGLFAAMLASEAGLDVEIVDQEWRIGSRSYACALHPHTLEILDRLGLLGPALDLGVRVDTVAFYEGKDRRAQVDLARLPVRFPFALVIYQDDLEGLIEDALRERHSRRVGWGQRLGGLIWGDESSTAILELIRHRATGHSDQRWTEVVGRRRRVGCRFLVGADGPQSRLLHLLGTQSDVADAPSSYSVFEFEARTSRDITRELRVAIDGPATHVMWPLPGGTCRWTLQATADAAPKQASSESGNAPLGVADRIAAVAPWFGRGVRELDWASRVEFPRRLAHQFGRGHCWVLGDAAHQTAPGGAQGMNLGIREADEFVDEVRGILREGRPSTGLRDASQRWHEEWQRLLGLIPSMEAGPGTDPWVVKHMTQLASSLPAGGIGFAGLMSQLGLKWAGS